MRNKKGSEGVIVIVLSFILVTVSVLAAILSMQRQRAPMAANVLKRTQAYYYAEAALYETFNRFRNNTYPYTEWNPAVWAGGTTPIEQYDPPGDPTGIHLVDPSGQPIVEFLNNSNEVVAVVRIDVVTDAGKYMVRAAYDYTGLDLQAQQ